MINLNDLDFEQISTFKNLKEIIKSDDYYSSLYFLVEEYDCRQNVLYKSKFYRENKKVYKFGNIINKDNWNNRVHITIYKDFGELTAEFEHQSFTEESEYHNKFSSSTLEEKIITLLDKWKTHYCC
ncbi:hypothetical protein [uncultured Clostridium sp.]|uniref:hypothetical protein n=1 Tax=uncultured Clostridium sp. TaxID=59620 RepID=UPI0026161240|nr:hypothetical protein [uncultured Clostridium sp.]